MIVFGYFFVVKKREEEEVISFPLDQEKIGQYFNQSSVVTVILIMF